MSVIRLQAIKCFVHLVFGKEESEIYSLTPYVLSIFFWRHVTKAVNVFNAKSHYETGNLIKELLRSASDICTKMSASTHKTKIRKKIIIKK